MNSSINLTISSGHVKVIMCRLVYTCRKTGCCHLVRQASNVAMATWEGSIDWLPAMTEVLRHMGSVLPHVITHTFRTLAKNCSISSPSTVCSSSRFKHKARIGFMIVSRMLFCFYHYWCVLFSTIVHHNLM